MKYIDADLLRKEIEKRIKSSESCPFIEAEFGAEERRDGKIRAYNEILDLLDTLQQKQPIGEEYAIEIGKHSHTIRVGSQSDIDHLIHQIKQGQMEADVNLREPNDDLSEEIENFCLEYDARKEAWYNMLPKDQKLVYNPTWQNFATNLAYHFYNRGYNAVKEK